MAHVRFTRHLRRFFPTLGDCEVAGGTVAEVVGALEARWPGLAAYVVTEDGALRKHVNIFVNGELVRDRAALTDAVVASDELDVIQALSGG